MSTFSIVPWRGWRVDVGCMFDSAHIPLLLSFMFSGILCQFHVVYVIGFGFVSPFRSWVYGNGPWGK